MENLKFAIQEFFSKLDFPPEKLFPSEIQNFPTRIFIKSLKTCPKLVFFEIKSTDLNHFSHHIRCNESSLSVVFCLLYYKQKPILQRWHHYNIKNIKTHLRYIYLDIIYFLVWNEINFIDWHNYFLFLLLLLLLLLSFISLNCYH